MMMIEKSSTQCSRRLESYLELVLLLHFQSDWCIFHPLVRLIAGCISQIILSAFPISLSLMNMMKEMYVTVFVSQRASPLSNVSRQSQQQNFQFEAFLHSVPFFCPMMLTSLVGAWSRCLVVVGQQSFLESSPFLREFSTINGARVVHRQSARQPANPTVARPNPYYQQQQRAVLNRVPIYQSEKKEV